MDFFIYKENKVFQEKVPKQVIHIKNILEKTCYSYK